MNSVVNSGLPEDSFLGTGALTNRMGSTLLWAGHCTFCTPTECPQRSADAPLCHKPNFARELRWARPQSTRRRDFMAGCPVVPHRCRQSTWQTSSAASARVLSFVLVRDHPSCPSPPSSLASRTSCTARSRAISAQAPRLQKVYVQALLSLVVRATSRPPPACPGLTPVRLHLTDFRYEKP